MPDRNPQAKMSFFEHLVELRRRLIYGALFVLAGFCVGYFFSKEIFNFLRVPYDQAFIKVLGSTPLLQETTLLEGFFVYLKVGFLSGIFIASPFLFYQFWAFVGPALKPNEKKGILPFVFLATLFFVGGALFGYFFVFPKSYEFLLSITKGQFIEHRIRMQDYFEFSSILLLGFGAAFEAPLIVLILVHLKVITAQTLLKSWRGAIITILIISAVLTPADIASMVFMAVPLIGLYGLVLVISFLFFNAPKNTPGTH